MTDDEIEDAIVDLLAKARECWRAMTPEQRHEQERRSRDAYIVVEFYVDFDGLRSMQVVRR
jgi:tellurite resistance-related uncharacterized protein